MCGEGLMVSNFGYRPTREQCQWRSVKQLWIVVSILPCRKVAFKWFIVISIHSVIPLFCIIIFCVIAQEWRVLFLLLTIEWKLKLTLSTSRNIVARILTPEVLYYFSWNMSRLYHCPRGEEDEATERISKLKGETVSELRCECQLKHSDCWLSSWANG